MRTWIAVFSAAVLLLFLSGCGAKTTPAAKTPTGKTEGHAHDEHTHEGHAHEGSHGGELIALDGEKAHIEFVHHAVEGKADLYITGPDGKTALPLEKAPELKLMTDEGPKVVKCEPADGSDGKASRFTASDEALKKDPLKGRIALEIDGTPYSPQLPEEHHHSH